VLCACLQHVLVLCGHDLYCLSCLFVDEVVKRYINLCTALLIKLLDWQTGEDSMHTVDFIARKIEHALSQWGFIRSDKIQNVWKRLSENLQNLEPDVAMFKINAFKGNFISRLLEDESDQNKKSKTFQAWEHHLLMKVQLCLFL
jgi:hypothetical protein